MIESLESRKLLSAAITVTQSGGALDIKGGSDGSTINVIESYQDVAGRVLVEDVGNLPGTVYDGVTSIKISGQAQTDRVFYAGRTIGAKINTGGGNDFITVTDAGTAGTYASGDGGDDDLTVLDANKTTVVGDGGGDTLYVSDAVAVGREVHLYGLGGSDIINIAGGTNFVYGGGGKDALFTNGTAGVDFVIAVMDSIETTGNIP